VLAQRAVSEDPRWTRAVEGSVGPSRENSDEQAWKSYRYVLAAALPGPRRVSARQGWAGEKSGPFEHPVGHSFASPEMQLIDFSGVHTRLSAC
jgi:hypothetical protein